VAEPDGFNAGRGAGGDVVPAVAHHPDIVFARGEYFTRMAKGMGIGFHRRIFARYHYIQRQTMPRENRFHAEPAIACDEGGANILLNEPREQFAAAGVQSRILRGMFFVLKQNCLGPAASRFLHFRQGFENRPIADSHLGLDARKIEHGFRESPVHVE
jgi:hypothetical protein